MKVNCIHLEHRTDREENMYRELISLNNPFKIWNGIYHPNGRIGVLESFKMIIRENINEPYVMIVEDDVKFTSDKSFERWFTSVNTLPNNWDLLLGGIYSGKVYDYNEYLKRVYDFSSLHCILIRNTLYDKILSYNGDNHLDRYLGQLSKRKQIDTFVCYPFVAIQYPGISDTVNKNVDYSDRLNKYKIYR